MKVARESWAEDELVLVDEGTVNMLQPAELISGGLGAEGSSNSGVKLGTMPRPRPSSSLQVNPMAAYSLLLSSEGGSREGQGCRVGATALSSWVLSSSFFKWLSAVPH